MNKRLKSVFIATYTDIKDGIRTNASGPARPLTSFFASIPGVTLYVLEQPLPGGDVGEVIFRKYTHGVKTIEERLRPVFTPKHNNTLSDNKTYLTLKLRDLHADFIAISRYVDGPVDLFIGLECVNACFGAFLRKLRRCAESAYYIFDWAPDRYASGLMNSAYLWLDKMAAYNCDYTWNIACTIGEARLEKLGYDEKRISPQLYVPYSVDYWPENISRDEQIDPDLIVYAGGLIAENGPQILIEAFAMVAKRYPKARLCIIGGGNDESRLRQRVTALGLNSRVEITGFIAEEARVIFLQKTAGVAVAPYPIMKGSRKPYGDVIKIRMYFACGLPVISTPVPPVIKEIRAEKLGLVTEDDSPEALARAMGVYLADPGKIFETRRRVAVKASTSSWRDNYQSTLNQMGYSL